MASSVPQHPRKATAQTQKSDHKTTASYEQVWSVGPKGGCSGPLRPNSPLEVHLQSSPPLLPPQPCRLLCGCSSLAEGSLKIPSANPSAQSRSNLCRLLRTLIGFWTSPRMHIPHIVPALNHPHCKNALICLNRISCLPMCAHCLLSFHQIPLRQVSRLLWIFKFI